MRLAISVGEDRQLTHQYADSLAAPPGSDGFHEDRKKEVNQGVPGPSVDGVDRKGHI